MTADVKSKQADVERIFQYQERLRESMQALKGTPEEKALTQEMQLGILRKDITSLEATEKQAPQELDTRIETLTLDTPKTKFLTVRIQVKKCCLVKILRIITTGDLLMCSGNLNHSSAYNPEFTKCTLGSRAEGV